MPDHAHSVTLGSIIVASTCLSACWSVNFMRDTDAGETGFSSSDSMTSSPSTGDPSSSSGGGTTTDGDASSDADPSASSDSTDSSEGPTTDSESEEGPCMSDEDCEEGYVCDDVGECILGCGTAVQEIPYIPPNVILILDKSGSMVNPELFWDDDNDDADDDGFVDQNPMIMATPKVSHWRSLHDVVTLILTNFNDKINMGATLFPSVDAQPVLGPAACLVITTPEIPVAPMNGNNVLAGIPPAWAEDLAGGTPAEKGVTTSYDHLKGLGGSNNPIAILVTDGAANCSTSAPDDMALLDYDENLVPTVAAAFNTDNIPTYVVGIDISSEPDPQGTITFDVLNDLAVAGGVPREGTEKFYNATNKQELQEALDNILDTVLDCTLEFPDGFPPDTEPTIDNYPQPLNHSADCSMEDGWKLNESGDFPMIDLCGALCIYFQQWGELQLKFVCSGMP